MPNDWYADWWVYRVGGQRENGSPSGYIGAMPADAFCTKCGEPLREGAEFCGACGYATGSLDGEAAPLPAGERTPNTTSSNRVLLGISALVVGVAITLFGTSYPFEVDCSAEALVIGEESCKWSGFYVGGYTSIPISGTEIHTLLVHRAEDNLRTGFQITGVLLAFVGAGAVVWPLLIRRPGDSEDDD
jgi:hypothetical protein